MITRVIKPRYLTALNPEQHARTCSYWFTVATFGCTPLTAFRTRPALTHWLDVLNISVVDDVDVPAAGIWKPLFLTGSYNVASYTDLAAFASISNFRPFQWLDNARYQIAKVTCGEDGIRTVHYLNCNVAKQEIHYALAREIEDRGDA